MAKQASRMMIGVFVVVAVIIMMAESGGFRFGQVLQENREMCVVLQ